jgi:hypothetical protein
MKTTFTTCHLWLGPPRGQFFPCFPNQTLFISVLTLWPHHSPLQLITHNLLQFTRRLGEVSRICDGICCSTVGRIFVCLYCLVFIEMLDRRQSFCALSDNRTCPYAVYIIDGCWIDDRLYTAEVPYNAYVRLL